MLNNKKGVSAVVATVLIVMITVAAVAIIWATVIPMIRNSAEEGTKCYAAQTDLVIKEGSYTCYNSTGPAGYADGSAKVQIEEGASTDYTLSGIDIQWISSGVSYNQTNTTTPGTNGVKVYTMNATLISSGNVPSEVTVAPIITIGNTETRCEPIQTVTLKECA